MFQTINQLLMFPSTRNATEDLEDDFTSTAARPLKKLRVSTVSTASPRDGDAVGANAVGHLTRDPVWPVFRQANCSELSHLYMENKQQYNI
jgi:hypothetical protein